jgi:hypothetical protein
VSTAQCRRRSVDGADRLDVAERVDSAAAAEFLVSRVAGLDRPSRLD